MVVAMNESSTAFQPTVWARRRLPLMPEGTGINIPSNILAYNLLLGGADVLNTLCVQRQKFQGEDVLR